VRHTVHDTRLDIRAESPSALNRGARGHCLAVPFSPLGALAAAQPALLAIVALVRIRAFWTFARSGNERGEMARDGFPAEPAH
jgi:hypothetical protein